MKKIWIAVLFLVFLVPLIAVADANAARPSNEKGTLTITKGAVLDHDVLNQHVTIDTLKVTLTFTGNLSGTTSAIERDVIHNQTTESGNHIFTTFHGQGNFTGTLNGSKTGTFEIRYNGHSNSTFERGVFIVNDGTGGLAGDHAQGKFSGSTVASGEPPSPVLQYTMHSHVSHHHEDTQGEDKDHDDHSHPDNEHGHEKD